MNQLTIPMLTREMVRLIINIKRPYNLQYKEVAEPNVQTYQIWTSFEVEQKDLNRSLDDFNDQYLLPQAYKLAAQLKGIKISYNLLLKRPDCSIERYCGLSIRGIF